MIRLLTLPEQPAGRVRKGPKIAALLSVAGWCSVSWAAANAQTATPVPPEPSEQQPSEQQVRDRLQRLQEGVLVPDHSGSEQTAITSFPTLGSAIFDAQLAGYIAYVEAFGTPDILIVGSSRALQGIDPEALATELAAQGYDALKVYNFSVNGATAQVVNFIVSELLPGDLPRAIVWGDGSRAFNDGRRDRTWESLLASPGYQAVQRGEAPALAPRMEVVDAEVAEASPAAADTDLLSWLRASTLQPATSQTVTLQAVTSQAVAARGTIPSSLSHLGLDGLGFSAVADRFDPAIYYQSFARVSGQYDGAYAPFSLGGDQAGALAAMAEAVRSQGSHLVFVNLPLSDSYLDDFRRYYEGQFQRFLQAQSTRRGFEVVDLLLTWQGQPELFADPSHINQHGAAAIAAQLALNPALQLAFEAQAGSIPDAATDGMSELLLNPSTLE